MLGTLRKKKGRTRSKSATPAPKGGFGGRKNSKKPATLFEAVERGTVEDVQRLHEAGLGMAARDDHGRTALHCAAAAGRPDMVSFMLSLHSVPVDSRDERGMTPLYAAVMKGSQRCVRILLKAGASPNAPAASGITPLLWSANKAPHLHNLMQEYVVRSPAEREAEEREAKEAAEREAKYRDSAVRWGSRTLYLGDSFCGGGMLINRERLHREKNQDEMSSEGVARRAPVVQQSPLASGYSAQKKSEALTADAGLASASVGTLRASTGGARARTGSLQSRSPQGTSSRRGSQPLSPQFVGGSPGTAGSFMLTVSGGAPTSAAGSVSPIQGGFAGGIGSGGTLRLSTGTVRVPPSSGTAGQATRVGGSVLARSAAPSTTSDASVAASARKREALVARALQEGTTLGERICVASECAAALVRCATQKKVALRAATAEMTALLKVLRPLLAQLPFALRALVPLLHERMQSVVDAARKLQAGGGDIAAADFRRHVALMVVSLWQMHLAVGHLDRKQVAKTTSPESRTPMLDMMVELLRRLVPSPGDTLGSVATLHAVVRARLVHSIRELISQVAAWQDASQQAAVGHHLATVYKGATALVDRAKSVLEKRGDVSETGNVDSQIHEALGSLSAALRHQVRSISTTLTQEHKIGTPLQDVAALPTSFFTNVAAQPRQDSSTTAQIGASFKQCTHPLKRVAQLAKENPQAQSEAIVSLATLLVEKIEAFETALAPVAVAASTSPSAAAANQATANTIALSAALALSSTAQRLVTLSARGRTSVLIRDCASALTHYRAGLVLLSVGYVLHLPYVRIICMSLYVQGIACCAADVLKELERNST